MSEDVFDVMRHSYGLRAIEEHAHRSRKQPETIAAQERLLRKWRARATSLHAAPRLDPEIIQARQLERIAQLVDHAFTTHPFYHELYRSVGYREGDIVTWTDYHALPAITKREIVSNFEAFTRANLAPRTQECYVSTTSGSSGQVLTAMFDRAAIDEDMMQCMRFYEQMLGRTRGPSEWLYQVYLVNPPFTSLCGAYPTFTVSNECPPEAVLEHLSLLKPAILAGFPSYLERLGALVTDPRKLGILAINTNSEASTVAQRRHISEQFHAPVFDEYSTVELALIATQCRHGCYHLVEDSVRVDVLHPDDTSMGEIVATSLFNSFMPFIRYRQGDILQLHEHGMPCECGSTFRRLAAFEGRTDQFLVSRHVGTVAPHHVMALYDRTMLAPDANVAEFQISQVRPDEVRLVIVKVSQSQPVNRRAIDDFATGLRQVFRDDDLKVLVEERSSMPPEKSHKRRLIKCEIERAPEKIT